MPRSQIAGGVPTSFFAKLHSKITNRKGCPPKVFQHLRCQDHRSQGVSPQSFFAKLHSKITNRKGCPPKVFNISDAKITDRKGCPHKFLRETTFQNHKSQGVSPKVFQHLRCQDHRSQGVSTQSFFAKLHSKITNRKGCPPKVFHPPRPPLDSPRALLSLNLSSC